VGKCEDGSFYHLVITRFNVHIYRRYYNGKRWITTRVLAGIGNVMRGLRTLPSRVRNIVRQVLEGLKIYVKESLDKLSKNVVRLGILTVECFRNVAPYLDHVPSKLRGRVYTILEEYGEKLLRELKKLELPDRTRNRILNAIGTGMLEEVLKAVETSLIEVAL